MAWSRISSKVIATLPLPLRLAEDGLEITDTAQMHVYRKRPTKESRKCWECEVGDAAARLATAYRGPYNGTLPRLSGRRLKACWTWIMARPKSRELKAQSDNLPVRGRVWLRFFGGSSTGVGPVSP